jgi:hypothetical protein
LQEKKILQNLSKTVDKRFHVMYYMHILNKKEIDMSKMADLDITIQEMLLEGNDSIAKAGIRIPDLGQVGPMGLYGRANV